MSDIKDSYTTDVFKKKQRYEKLDQSISNPNESFDNEIFEGKKSKNKNDLENDYDETQEEANDLNDFDLYQDESIDEDKVIYTKFELLRRPALFFVEQPHILYGYRAHLDMNFKLCLKTIFMFHNESLNFWTHFLGFLYFLFQFIQILFQTKTFTYETFQSQVLITLGVFAMLVSMSASSIYHQFNILGYEYYLKLLRFDLIGIGVQVFVGSIISIYVGFHNYQKLGLSLISILFGLMILNSILQSTTCYMSSGCEKFRIAFFSFILLYCFIAFIYWTFTCATQIEFDLLFWGTLKSFLYLILGFCFYMTKCPERFVQNKWVQQLFHGHMWWHLLTFLNGYTLFWMLHYALQHMEKFQNEINN